MYMSQFFFFIYY